MSIALEATVNFMKARIAVQDEELNALKLKQQELEARIEAIADLVTAPTKVQRRG